MKTISAKTIYTGKNVLSNSNLLFNGKKISSISKAKTGRKLGQFDVITPAFIDPHSHIGMERAGEPIPCWWVWSTTSSTTTR